MSTAYAVFACICMHCFYCVSGASRCIAACRCSISNFSKISIRNYFRLLRRSSFLGRCLRALEPSCVRICCPNADRLLTAPHCSSSRVPVWCLPLSTRSPRPSRKLGSPHATTAFETMVCRVEGHCRTARWVLGSLGLFDCCHEAEQRHLLVTEHRGPHT